LTKGLLILAAALTASSAIAQARVDELPSAVLQPDEAACALGETSIVNLLQREWRPKSCVLLYGGFSEISGSFAGILASTRNLLHLGETLSLSAEYGVRRRRVQFGFDKPSLFSGRIDIGFTVYGQRFQYNQASESSIFAFQRDIPEFGQFAPGDLIDYVSHSYGGTGFARYRLRRISSEVGLTYRYDVSHYTTLTGSTADYFTGVDSQALLPPTYYFNGFDIVASQSGLLNQIRTGTLTPSFTRSTIDNPLGPTRGTEVSISTAIAGAGGDVNTIEPVVVVKSFRRGFKARHVIGMRLLGRMVTGYGGNNTPPFDRYYMGGEEDIRGFDSWSISPIVYLPSTTTVDVYNANGTQRVEPIFNPNGTITYINVTQTVPSYQMVSAGGDTNVVINLEYRIPAGGPFTLAFFTDGGVDRVTFPSQLQVSPGVLERLNGEFPQTGFDDQMRVQAGTEKPRVSNGVELQVLVPRINAPLRFYGAYNPLEYRGIVQAPLAINRSMFANDATYENAVSVVGSPIPLREPRFMFRFSIGRTLGGRP